jgi:hypothetical protein
VAQLTGNSGSSHTLCCTMSVLPQVHRRVVCILSKDALKMLMPKHLCLFRNILFGKNSPFEKTIYFTATCSEVLFHCCLIVCQSVLYAVSCFV